MTSCEMDEITSYAAGVCKVHLNMPLLHDISIS